MEDALPRPPLNGNLDTTQKYTYKREIVSEINDSEEIPEHNFPVNLKLTKQYQWKYPRLLAKYKEGKHQKVIFVELVI